MNDKYNNIDFDSFLIEPSKQLSEEEEKKYVSNFNKSIGLDKQERKARGFGGYKRKVVALVAAMVLIFAFGAAAYATDMFGFGVLKYEWGQEETAYPEDSAQFKALEEYGAYTNKLSDEEYHEYVYTMDGSINPKDKKLKEILDKYNLVFPDSSKITYADSADEMFDKAEIPNFLGKSKGYYYNKNEYDPGYLNYDVGKIEVAMNLSEDLYYDKEDKLKFYPEKYKDDSWHIQCLKKNVFPQDSVNPYGWDLDNDGNNSFSKWSYVTKDGTKVTCVGAIEDGIVSYDKYSGNKRIPSEMPFTQCVYSMVATFDDYSVLLSYTKTVDSNTKEISKIEFEDFLDEFEFAKLK